MSMGVPYAMSIYCFIDNQMAINTCHFTFSLSIGPGSDTLGDVLKNYCDGAVDTAYLPAMADGAKLVGVKLARVGTLTPPLPGIITYGDFGTGGTGVLPTQVTGLIRTQTYLAGRAYRGRVFTPFPWIGWMDSDGTPTAAYVTLLNGIYAAVISGGSFSTSLSTYDANPCIYHRKTGKSGVPLAGTTTTIISGAARKAWATQRKRGDLGRLNVPFIS